ncbi:hypothetical protein Agub_g9490, partial [Astrephomene gubernaculifera]
FVRGSRAHRLLLDPLVACSLDQHGCIAPPGHSRQQHCYEQTALTLLIRHHNYSTCLPREHFATSSTRKTSYDPRVSSAPIVIASRRYRQPKPYRPLLQSQPDCRPDPSSNPWPSETSTSIAMPSLRFRMELYGRAVADFAVQAGCCTGLHALIQAVLWAQFLIALLRGFGFPSSPCYICWVNRPARNPTPPGGSRNRCFGSSGGGEGGLGAHGKNGGGSASGSKGLYGNLPLRPLQQLLLMGFVSVGMAVVSWAVMGVSCVVV